MSDAPIWAPTGGVGGPIEGLPLQGWRAGTTTGAGIAVAATAGPTQGITARMAPLSAQATGRLLGWPVTPSS